MNIKKCATARKLLGANVLVRTSVREDARKSVREDVKLLARGDAKHLAREDVKLLAREDVSQYAREDVMDLMGLPIIAILIQHTLITMFMAHMVYTERVELTAHILHIMCVIHMLHADIMAKDIGKKKL